MQRRLQLTALVAVVAALGVVGAVVATGGNGIREKLSGYNEQPLAISTTGSGKFEASFTRFGDTLHYRLSYRDLEGTVTQAHIHFGAENQAAGSEPRDPGRPPRRGRLGGRDRSAVLTAA